MRLRVCKLCDKTVTCSKTGLKRHMSSNKREENCTATKHAPTISGMWNKIITREEASSKEIKICSFSVEPNLPLSISEAFLSPLQSMFPSDIVLKNVRLGKQKAANVVRQVIGFDNLNEAVSVLRSRKFSFIINETTDKSTAKTTSDFGHFFRYWKFSRKAVPPWYDWSWRWISPRYLFSREENIYWVCASQWKTS